MTAEAPASVRVGHERRTKDQCEVAMMRFHPACNLAEVVKLLKRAGYSLARTANGVTWIQPQKEEQP